MKVYDPEEKFEINLDRAYQVNGLHYKGVKTQYLEDTNTLIFSRDKEYLIYYILISYYYILFYQYY